MLGKRAGFYLGRSASVALLILVALTAACGASNEIKLDAKDNGSKVEMKAGQVLVISLESNPTTGYAWEVVDLEEGILQQLGESEFEPESKAVGAGGMQTFRFKALKTGHVELKLLHHRSWEKNEEPLDTFTIQVVVK